MASKHRRIALTADPDLEAAIAAARQQLGDMPESRVVRELALRGAADLPADSTISGLLQLRQRGVEWPSRTLAEVLGHDPPVKLDVDDPYRATEALEEARGDRV